VVDCCWLIEIFDGFDMKYAFSAFNAKIAENGNFIVDIFGSPGRFTYKRA
jgi:hypothetical protein